MEIAIPLCVISGIFEVWLPARPVFGISTVSDPWDILAYTLGGAVAYGIWNRPISFRY